MVALVATGCGFEVKNTPGDGGALDAPGTMMCPWPYAPSGFDPCAGVPSGMLPVLDLSEVGVYVYDTDDNTLTPPTGSDLVVLSTLVGGARVIWSGSFKVGPQATLRVTGDVPLVVVSQSTVTIDGTVDVGSYLVGSDRVGAGSNPAVCATATLFGMTCSHGGSGGGGGGFGTAGASGGVGGLTHDCGLGGSAGIPGGPGGPASADLSLLRGGCDGGDGADGNGPDGGDGGDGGGAIQLLARDVLRVGSTGKVLAGGGGGTGGNNGRSGGGGGGSGGSLLLGGTSITIAGVLAANGAGGGGGSNGSQAGHGADGLPSLTVAVGGMPEGTSGTGGNGAAGALPATAGTGVDRGGGGGGGGAGKIRLTTKPGNAPVTVGAVITPAPT